MLPYQNSVDTRTPPLDEIDGAARILDPVCSVL